MNDEEKEKKLVSLLAPRRPEAFWARQKAEILSALPGAGGPFRAWLLAPAAAAAAVLVLLLARPQGPAPQPAAPAVSTAFLENLDLLDDMDVLEAVPEKDL